MDQVVIGTLTQWYVLTCDAVNRLPHLSISFFAHRLWTRKLYFTLATGQHG